MRVQDPEADSERVMNERIQELNLQAMSIVMNGSDPNGDVDKMYIPSDFTEKFAELIVRDCMDVVEQDMKLAHIQMIPLTLEKYANGRLKEKIKEHFGDKL